MKSVSFLTFFILSIFCLNAISQGVDCMVPTPENAASQLDYQYNPNTGTANIQIPLCGINAGNYLQDVSIYYNTSGIQVSQAASCVGLGWELSAEGSISRIVRGIPDDNNSVTDGYGWLHVNTNDIRDFPVDGTESLRALWLDGVLKSSSGELDSEPDIYYISLPSLSCSFVFSNGNANSTREIMLMPYQNLRITYTLDSFGKIECFKVIDSNGDTYIFNVPVVTHSTITTMTNTPDSYLTQDYPFVNLSNGINFNQNYIDRLSKRDRIKNFNSLNSNRIDVDPYYSISQDITEMWKISLLITPMKDTMHYSYSTEQIPSDSYIYKAYKKYLSGQPDSVIAYQRINNGGAGYMIDKKITSISSNTGKIEFVYDSQEREDLDDSKKLNSIKAYAIQNGELHLMREYDFYHSYFESCTSSVFSDSYEARYRLKLDSLCEKHGINSLPSYIFYYDYSSQRRLPSRYSYAQDIWGFYNGQVTNNSFVPAVYVYPERTGSDRFRLYPVTDPVTGHGFDDEYVLPGANRLPDDEKMTIGMLEGIRTPTNEVITLYYEPHEFTYYYSDDHTLYSGGGLRLTEKSASISEKYYYKEYSTELSSGQILALPCYGYFDPSSWPESAEDRDQEFFNDNYIRVNQNLSSSLDGSILYKEVYIQDSFKGTQIMKFENGPALDEENFQAYEWFKPTFIYHCRTYSDENDDWQPMLDGLNFGFNEYPFTPHSSYFWNRGLLAETVSLNDNGSKVARTVNYYDIFTPDDEAPDSVCGIQVGFLKNNTPGILRFPLYTYGKYPVYGNLASIPVRTKEIIFNPDNDQDSLFTQTYFEYNNYGQLAKSRFVNSNGDELLTEVKFIPDYWDTMTTPATSDPTAEAIIYFYNKNILDIPVEKLQLIKKDGEEDLFVTGGTITTFKFFELGNNLTPVPMPDSTFALPIQNPVYVKYFTSSGITNLTFVKDSRYECRATNDIYSSSGVLLQSHIINGNYTTIIPGYDSTVTIATCSNSLLDEVGYTGFELDEGNGWEGFGYVAEIITTINARSGNKVLSPEYNSRVQRDFNIQEGLESQAGYQASVWVKGTSAAQLKISINGTDNIKTAASTSANDWNLLEVYLSRAEIEEYQGTIYFIRVMAINTGYGTVWFDDIRFHPSDASMSVCAYDTC